MHSKDKAVDRSFSSLSLAVSCASKPDLESLKNITLLEDSGMCSIWIAPVLSTTAPALKLVE
ncbi:hypothetical protein DPMN_136576 [Dreissena polymorpha]|uniref:Uncharacterized protein n=1 Tax=Dreissena polymorpha TaxID=45954 RepID=A0A9D4G0A3_DREPO|nr:hypothetical protein DPMN_136576 [Dreissena polymorpha]